MKIYTDIPVPARANIGKSKYPLADLEVGHSLFVETKAGESVEAAAKRVAGSVARYRRAQVVDTIKFAVRTTTHPETGAGCVGVWRTA